MNKQAQRSQLHQYGGTSVNRSRFEFALRTRNEGSYDIRDSVRESATVVQLINNSPLVDGKHERYGEWKCTTRAIARLPSHRLGQKMDKGSEPLALYERIWSESVPGDEKQLPTESVKGLSTLSTGGIRTFTSGVSYSWIQTPSAAFSSQQRTANTREIEE